jgi:hypothetical protein
MANMINVNVGPTGEGWINADQVAFVTQFNMSMVGCEIIFSDQTKLYVHENARDVIMRIKGA